MNAPSVDEVKRDRKISNQARWLASAAALATLIKLWLAWKTQGTLDIPAYQDHLNKLREYGAAAYNLPGIFGNPLNVPPFAINLVRGAEFLATRTGVPFRFWFRLPAIFADAGSIWIVWQIAMRSPQLKIDFRLLLLMAICPASIMISGIHGNLDPLTIFGVLLSLFLLTQKGSTWLAGLVFGMALNIKVVPLIFAPTIFFYLPDLRPRLRFFCTALALFLIGSLPHLLQNPFGIIGAVFGHAGMYSHWGWTLLLVMAQHQTPFSRESGFHPPGVHAVAAALGKYLLIASIISLSFWLNKKKSPPHLFVQSGAIAFLFMFLTPGFGAQYLSWLAPWVIAVGLRPTVVFYATSGAYLLMAYGCVALLFGCDSYLYLGLVCWISILFVLACYWSRLTSVTDELADKAVV